MSENESRFFQLPSGTVVRVRGVEQVRDYEEDPAATEVQVVPVDAIVIRRDELPEVDPGDDEDSRPSSRPMVRATRGDILGRYITSSDTVESLRSKAAMYLALSEHLREHPPVDEEQVKALGDAFRDAGLNRPFADDLVKLIRAGVRYMGEE